MPQTRDDWEREHPPTPSNGKEHSLAQLLQWQKQATVAMEKLTQQPEWDAYLQIVAGQVVVCREAQTALAGALAREDMVDHAQLMICKLQMAKATGAVEALEWAMAWPKKLLAQAQETASNKIT